MLTVVDEYTFNKCLNTYSLMVAKGIYQWSKSLSLLLGTEGGKETDGTGKGAMRDLPFIIIVFFPPFL